MNAYEKNKQSFYKVFHSQNKRSKAIYVEFFITQVELTIEQIDSLIEENKRELENLKPFTPNMDFDKVWSDLLVMLDNKGVLIECIEDEDYDNIKVQVDSNTPFNIDNVERVFDDNLANNDLVNFKDDDNIIPCIIRQRVSDIRFIEQSHYDETKEYNPYNIPYHYENHTESDIVGFIKKVSHLDKHIIYRKDDFKKVYSKLIDDIDNVIEAYRKDLNEEIKKYKQDKKDFIKHKEAFMKGGGRNIK